MSFDPAAVETPAAPHPHPTPSAMYCDTRVVTLLCLALFWPACPGPRPGGPGPCLSPRPLLRCPSTMRVYPGLSALCQGKAYLPRGIDFSPHGVPMTRPDDPILSPWI